MKDVFYTIRVFSNTKYPCIYEKRDIPANDLKYFRLMIEKDYKGCFLEEIKQRKK